ncbi:polyamine oxidase 7-like isoform X2 [Haliotis rufescens]|uniref:polyamine oxidase 7-like isoform X2 n=2 Tax=Haliotis rufescens TaxID=6454 RepID=UPI00201F92E0|nr:polyamine oxidase 7-like isoform X2 [Haliotis rufescens]
MLGQVRAECASTLRWRGELTKMQWLNAFKATTITVLLITFLDSIEFQQSQCGTDTRHSQVLILGAGASGLAAAKTLGERNIPDYRILEGSNRIGGRVKSVTFGGKTVEEGANWVIGKEGTPLWDVVQKYNVSGKASDRGSVLIRNVHGANVTDTEGEDAWIKLEAAKRTVSEIFKCVKNKKWGDMSVRTCLDIGGWSPKTPVENVVEIFDYDFEYGGSPEVTSCYGVGMTEDAVNDMYYIIDERGYEYILKTYAVDALTPNDQRLHLNEVVTSINYSDTRVAVTTQSGKVFTANVVIVTFSIGVLQSGSVIFNPPLPDWKIDNLFRVRFENYVSVYLKFPNTSSRFWDNTEYILYADDRRGVFPVWQNLEVDGLFPPGTNILKMVTQGEDADRVSELTDAEITGEVMAILRRVYTNVVDPEDVFITNWKNNPLYMGSFCNMKASAFRSDIFEAIRAPVRNVFFAGEAFDSEFSCYSTGAARSGIYTANEVSAYVSS